MCRKTLSEDTDTGNKDIHHSPRVICLSRRIFLKSSLAFAASGMFACKTSDKGYETETDNSDSAAEKVETEGDIVNIPDKDAVAFGLYSPSTAGDPEKAVRLFCKELDWSWLSKGDSVFVKIACNSGKAHPAVTSPSLVSAVCRELFERGAGKVIAGDQAGLEDVCVAEGDKIYGSTRELMKGNGLLDAINQSGAEPYFFEEHGYEKGYFQDSFSFEDHHWTDLPYVANIIKEVDHIVVLPRLSSHLITGYSHGHKNAVGWLRYDSRFQMHFKGDSIHEKYTEINYLKEIRKRYRLTITLAEKILLDQGPNDGTIADTDPLILIASPDLASHDAFSVAVLAYIDSITPPDQSIVFPYGENADIYNNLVVTMFGSKYGIPWGTGKKEDYTSVAFHDYQKGIKNDRGLVRAYEISGGIPSVITVNLYGEKPDDALQHFLKIYSDGIFNLVV